MEKAVGNILPYKNIFLSNYEELETYRRGVFFSGPTLKLNISAKGDNANSYICYKKNDRHFCLVHAKDASLLTKEYTMAIPLDRFLSLIIGNTTSIKAQLGKVISDSLKQSRKLFEAEEKKSLQIQQQQITILAILHWNGRYILYSRVLKPHQNINLSSRLMNS